MGPGKMTNVAVAHVLGSSCTRYCGVHTPVWMTHKFGAGPPFLSSKEVLKVVGSGLDVHSSLLEQLSDFTISSTPLLQSVDLHPTVSAHCWLCGVRRLLLRLQAGGPILLHYAETDISRAPRVSVDHMMTYHGAAYQRTLCILCRLYSIPAGSSRRQ